MGWIGTLWFAASLGLALILGVDGQEAVAQQTEQPFECVEQLAPQDLQYGEHTIECEIGEALDFDRFFFEGEAGDEVRINVRTLTNGLDLSLEVRGPDGTILSQKSCSGSCGAFNTPCQCGFRTIFEDENTLPESGQYLLTFSETQTNEVGGYQLQLERVPPIVNPPSMEYDASLFDGLNPRTDIDYFTFEGAANTEIRLEFSTLTNGLDPKLEIIDPAGEAFFAGSCSGSCGAFNTPCKCDIIGNMLLPPLDGTYFVRIEESQIDETGNYRLNLQCLFPPLGCPFSDALVGEGFGQFQTQIDEVGELIGDDLFFSVFGSGAAVDAVVANSSGDAAAYAGLDADGDDVFWTLGAMPSATPGVLLTGNLPANTDQAKTGVFASLFQNPQDLTGRIFLARARSTPLGAAAGLRAEGNNAAESLSIDMLVTDEDGNQATCGQGDLDAAFKTQAVVVETQSCLPTGGAVEIDLTRIIGLAFAVSTQQATSLMSQTDISDVLLRTPPCVGSIDFDGDCVPDDLDNCQFVVNLDQGSSCESIGTSLGFKLGTAGVTTNFTDGLNNQQLFFGVATSIYASACDAAAAFGLGPGPQIIVDPDAFTIEIRVGTPVDEVEECTGGVQVSGLEGGLGPLSQGEWTVFSNELELDETFTVPESGAGALQFAALATLFAVARVRGGGRRAN